MAATPRIPQKVTGSFQSGMTMTPHGLKIPLPDRPSQVGLGPKIPQKVTGSFPYPAAQWPQAPAGHVDPFAQVDVHQQIRNLIGTMPPPLTPGQIQTQVRGMVDPVVNQITQAIQARAQAGMASVSGYAKSLADSLAQTGAQNVMNAYDPAEAGTAAANSALADRVTGAGNANSDALAARLKSINEPGATDPAIAALRTDATGAGNASYAVGNASLEQMLAEHGAASAYANKLPDIARLTGIQQSANVQGTANSDLASQLGPIYSQIPSLVENLRSTQDTKQSNYQSRADSLYGTLTGQNITRAAAKAATAKTSLPDATLSSRLGYVVDSTGHAIPNAKGEGQLLPGFKWNAAGTGTEKVAKASKPAAPPKVSTTLSAAAGHLVDTSGDPIVRNGGTVPYTPYVKPTTAKTATVSATLLKEANKQADIFYNGIPAHQHYNTTTRSYEAVPGTGQDYTPYPDALRKMIALKPGDPAWAKRATAILNSRYKEGEGGRPFSASTKKAVGSAVDAVSSALKGR